MYLNPYLCCFKIKLSSKLLMSECSSYVLKAQHFGKISALQDPDFRFRFWVLFSILGVTVESNTSELKKLAQIFLQRFTSPRLQHILWSIYSFPDFSFIMEFSKFHGTLWDCWARKKCQSSRWGAHVHPTESLSPGAPSCIPCLFPKKRIDSMNITINS